jgi:hypothetical protein
MVGCEVALDRLDLCPFEGRVSIQGLRVENPKVFVAAKPEVYGVTPLFKLDDFTVHVDVPTLFKDGAFSTQDVRVKNVTLKGLRVLVAWDTWSEGDTDYVVTNIDGLMMQMGLKGLPTPEVLAEEKAAAAQAEATAQAQTEKVAAEQAAQVEAKRVALDAELKVGDKVQGKVVVMADYGAFIEIAPGVSVEVARASVSGVAEEPVPVAK